MLSLRQFLFEYKLNIAELNIADRIFAVLPLLVSELLTFNVLNVYLTMILMELEKFWELFWKEMLHLKFKIMMKPYFHLYLTFSRQLDNDDANDDENDIDIFPGQTNI